MWQPGPKTGIVNRKWDHSWILKMLSNRMVNKWPKSACWASKRGFFLRKGLPSVSDVILSILQRARAQLHGSFLFLDSSVFPQLKVVKWLQAFLSIVCFSCKTDSWLSRQKKKLKKKKIIIINSNINDVLPLFSAHFGDDLILSRHVLTSNALCSAHVSYRWLGSMHGIHSLCQKA